MTVGEQMLGSLNDCARIAAGQGTDTATNMPTMMTILDILVRQCTSKQSIYRPMAPCFGMVFKVNIPAALQGLSRIHNRLLELVEWDQLARQEARHDLPPAFRPQTSFRKQLRDDVRSMHHHFLGLASNIGHVLSRYDFACTEDDRSAWSAWLNRLENEVLGLQIGTRFLNA